MIKRMEEVGVAVYVAEIVNACGVLVVKSINERDYWGDLGIT